MDKAIADLVSSPPPPSPVSKVDEAEYDKSVRDFVKRLDKVAAKHFVRPVNGRRLTESISPSSNSLIYLYALLAQVNAEKKDGVLVASSSTWSDIQKYIAGFDPVQVRYVGYQWRQLMEDLLAAAEASSDADQAQGILNLVQAAMLRLDPGTPTFTSLHLELVRSSLYRRAFDASRTVLANDIFHFPAKSESNRYTSRLCSAQLPSSAFITTSSGFSRELSYRDHLQYYLFGAMSYIAQLEWSRALLFLELVLLAPVNGNTASMIQVEAYKKWLLVGILHNGRTSSLPRSISPHTSKLLNSLSKPYVALAEAYKEQGPQQLLEEYQAGTDDRIWQTDCNEHLVKLVLASHRRAQILDYSRIYSSIPLSMLATEISTRLPTQPEKTATVEREIRDIVDANLINAALVQGQDGITYLRFLSPDGKVPLSNSELALRLGNSLSQVGVLDVYVKDSQKRIELSKDYLLAIQKRKLRSEGGRGTDDINMDSGGSLPGMPGSMEEDMLADM